MIPEPSLGGYFLYLLEIFVPGFGFGELFSLWKKDNSILERAGLAFGLGLSIDTIVLMIKTSNVAGLAGISTAVLYGIIGLGAIAFVASFIVHKTRLEIPKITRTDAMLLALLVVQALMLLLYFEKYPIFPEYQSHDYTVHVQLALGLISGSVTTIPSGILYYGIHFQLASGILFVGGQPLITVRQTMAILVVLSSLLFYSATKKIFSSSIIGLICTSIYVLSGTIWFASVFDSGLFANFYGILSALFLLVALVGVVNNLRAISSWIIFLIAVVNAYFSHYTLLTILPAILFLPLLQLVLVKKNKTPVIGYLVPALVVIIPAVIPLVVFPGLGSRIISLASSGGGTLSGSTVLSSAFGSLPVLSYLALEIFDDYAVLIMLLLSGFYLYQIVRTRNPIYFIPIIWFLSLIIAAPNNVSAWRFSYEAIVPLTLMASFGLSLILPQFGNQSKKRSTMPQRTRADRGSIIPRVFVFLILIGGIIIGSWGTSLLTDSLTSTDIGSQSQFSIYNAINWLGTNAPNNSSYLSLTDWRFTYTNLIIGQVGFYQYARFPSQALLIAKNLSANYIIVTNVTTLSLPPVASLYPWNNFPSSSNSNLTLVYQDQDVRVFHITGNVT